MLVVIVISDHRNYIILKQTSYLTSMEVFYIKGFPTDHCEPYKLIYFVDQ